MTGFSKEFQSWTVCDSGTIIKQDVIAYGTTLSLSLITFDLESDRWTVQVWDEVVIILCG